MDLGLSGRVALVGGSSTGLGRAVARELAAEGADVVLCARGEKQLEETRAAIEAETGADVAAVTADLSTLEGVEAAVTGAERAFGRIDILVTNTGGPPAGSFETHDLDTWRSAERLLLESVVELVRRVLPGMKERRWGRIITITSIAVKQPIQNLILSNSLRAAVTGLARTLANDVAPLGITVNNVMPGYTRTQRLEELSGGAPGDETAFEHWTREIPMGRIGRPRELAALVAFLASERASYITGTSVPVDGGWIRSLV
ncbi:MAG: SDR family oxidoreductase [Candidatus Palauibacterales bacterium]|nr:SDR family oxidoreductase [Candidatus Palauibacterales bacterium]MDP2528851.1 SDR family oxidoreductase [Candidatus Palauibacterales bacterium]